MSDRARDTMWIRSMLELIGYSTLPATETCVDNHGALNIFLFVGSGLSDAKFCSKFA